jgi:hypothetical protein
MVQSGAWKLELDSVKPGLTGTRAVQFRRRIEIVKVFMCSDKSLWKLAQESKKRKWSEEIVDRQAISCALKRAFKWLVEHGHLRRTALSEDF